MGLTKYLKEAFKKEYKERNADYRARIVLFRRDPVTLRIDRPTRLDRARTLGYRAKPGIFMVRQRVVKGTHERERSIKGKRSRNQSARVSLAKNYQQIAEEKVAKKFVNCEILNSYFVTQDGNHKWYEVIVVDKDHPAIIADKQLSWMSQPQNTRRVFRGLTSAGRKARGLRNKGTGAEKVRPSKNASYHRKVKDWPLSKIKKTQSLH